MGYLAFSLYLKKYEIKHLITKELLQKYRDKTKSSITEIKIK